MGPALDRWAGLLRAVAAWHDGGVRPNFVRSSAHRIGGPLLAIVALLAVSAVWGGSYPLTKVIFAELTPPQVLAARFTLAAIVTTAAFWRSIRLLSRRTLVLATLLGLLYGLAQIVQTVGLAHTEATISGFITGLYVVLTPLFSAVLVRTRVGGRVWVGAVLALIGLGIMTLRGFSLGFGEWLTLIGAVLYALHIVGLGAWSHARDALGMAVIQVIVVALVCLVAVVPDGMALPSSGSGWLILFYLAVVSGALSMIAQTWAQSQVPASRAAIVMSTEPVFAAAMAIGFLGEPLTWRVLTGGALMFTAMIVVESGPRSPADPKGQEDLPKLAG